MKIVLSLSVLILLLSCGKYKRPFITFKSPEKRLTESTWKCVKVVDADGDEFEIYDQIKFVINGSDSTFSRISNCVQLTSNYYSTANDTITGTWSWAYALDGKFNKQLIRHTNPGKIIRIISLSSKHLVFEDYSNDNSIYHYEHL